METQEIILSLPKMLQEMKDGILKEVSKKCSNARERNLEDRLRSLEEQTTKMSLLLHQL